mmetsp:Transcript_23984/g.33624  ORF Transcript_23984/g.33624 Transcript_23984/m.33624 type:complete len:263 (+) Transcript_23984:77-865(+)
MSNVKPNIPQEVKDLQAKAENADRDAILALGKCYFLGKNVPCDLEKAYTYFDDAAKLANQEAKYHVAFCMFYRVGTGEDSYKARHITVQAARAGYAPALLASHARKELASHSQIKNALHQVEKAAAAGDPFAQFRLAVCYERGDLVDKNLTEAFKWFLKSAEQGHVVAMHVVGLMMEEGSGVPKNVKEGIKWFERAGDRGFQDSQEHLRNWMKDKEQKMKSGNNNNSTTTETSNYLDTDRDNAESGSSSSSFAWIWAYCTIV